MGQQGLILEEEEEDEPIPPVEPGVEPAKITKEGDLGLPFSTEMEVPSFVRSVKDDKGRRRLYVENFSTCSVTGKRKLIGLSELDVSRDIVDFVYVT